jgi:hypothetical protein
MEFYWFSIQDARKMDFLDCTWPDYSFFSFISKELTDKSN